MAATSASQLARIVRPAAQELTGATRDYDALLERIGDARFVLLGEATHGTHEFYTERAEITRRLIREKGFSAVAVEADWPDAYRVNRYVQGIDDDASAEEALGDFRRFPTWMWRNTVVRDFAEWLRVHNDDFPRGTAGKVGFYGLDLYSLYGSIEAVIRFLDKVDPAAARRARNRYACFEDFGEDPQAYGMSVHYNLDRSCEEQAVAQLVDLQRRVIEYARRDGKLAEDEAFFAEQNARLTVNAEAYYRTMFGGRVSSWNLRDRHMADTLDALERHLDEQGKPAKIVVWEHNSHLGDARATEMGASGEWNVGQLVRERHGAESVLVGFTTYSGTVTAADDWDGPAETMRVRPGMEGSVEALFHEVGLPRFLLIPGTRGDVAEGLRESRLERAIGVVYRPATERFSHYFHTRLTDQFDAVIHIDQTNALEPLAPAAPPETEDAPETYPTGV